MTKGVEQLYGLHLLGFTRSGGLLRSSADVTCDLLLICRQCSVAQSCLTLCDPMNCSTPGFPALHHLPVQFSSVAQSCLTLCNPMNHSTLGLPVHHQLPESTQTHVHRVDDAIQPISSSAIPFSSCPQSFPASVSFQMSQLFTSGGQSIGVSASNEHPGLISFRMDWLDLLAVQGTLKSLLQYHSSKA